MSDVVTQSCAGACLGPRRRGCAARPTRRATRSRRNADEHARWRPSCASGSPPRASAARSGPGSGTSSAASCCPATGSTRCSTRARRSSSCSPLAADGMYDGEAPGRGHHHRHRPGRRPRVRDRRQRRDGQGRHLLPDDGQEAPARPGGRAGEPPAVRLPGRLRRRVPAPAGRGVPGPRPLRPDLLQPGARMSARGIPQIAAVLGLVHGRRRVRAGDERRDRDRRGTRARSSSAARRW